MSKYTASANRAVEFHVERIRQARDAWPQGSPQWCAYDAALMLVRVLAQQQEDS